MRNNAINSRKLQLRPHCGVVRYTWHEGRQDNSRTKNAKNMTTGNPNVCQPAQLTDYMTAASGFHYKSSLQAKLQNTNKLSSLNALDPHSSGSTRIS